MNQHIYEEFRMSGRLLEGRITQTMSKTSLRRSAFKCGCDVSSALEKTDDAFQSKACVDHRAAGKTVTEAQSSLVSTAVWQRVLDDLRNRVVRRN